VEICREKAMDEAGISNEDDMEKMQDSERLEEKNSSSYIYKKGDEEKATNYRGISLLCTAYKLYVEVLKNRLEKEAEKKRMIPETQADFRRGRLTIDNIFVIMHIIQREGSKKREDGKVFKRFADLKTAFDKVDRGKLWDYLRKKGRESLVRRIEKIYREQR